jgi:nitric oxide reductase NorD protein
MIRDSLFLFAESLAATGDRFAMLGFSSRRRDPVRVHTLKHFDEPYGASVRERIGAIKPGYYPRMGAVRQEWAQVRDILSGIRQLTYLHIHGQRG